MKKMSEYFSSMEDIEEFVSLYEDKLSPQEYKTFRMIFGLGEQEGDYIEIEGIGKIDKSIAHVIKRLNELGYKTLACCSGNREEHEGWTEDLRGYCSFLDDGNAERREAIREIAQKLEIEYEESETYLKPSYVIFIKKDSEGKKEVWRRLLSEIEDRENKNKDI